MNDEVAVLVTPGRFVRFGGLPFIAIVIPEAPDYSSRILGEGALLLLDPQALAACFSGFGLKRGSP